MRKRLVIGLAVVVVTGVLVTVMLLPIIFPATAMDLPYHQGVNASYSYGSCSYYQFNLDKPARMTGSFAASSNTTLYVTVGAQSFPGSGGCLGTPKYYYSTGSVHAYSLSLTLAPGTYVIGFAFTNRTAGQTWLNITKGFVATYIPAPAYYGPSCASLSCHQNDLGPQEPNGAK